MAAGLHPPAAAQQFAGDPIPNNMTVLNGAEIAFWNIKDPAGPSNNKTLTLTNYWSLQNDGARATPANVKRAIIVVHGLRRDAQTYMVQMLSALSQVTTDSNMNPSTIQIVAPVFSNDNDKNVTYPYYTYNADGVAYRDGAQSNTSALVWSQDTWVSGQPNLYPIGSTSTSTYDCLDQMLQYFDNKTLYPNIHQIVLAGHSAGAQVVDRYSAVQNSLSLSTPVTYWIGNPNDWLWLNSSRPYDTSTCATYDHWRSGLSSYAGSGMLYNTRLVAQGSSAVMAQYLAKNKAYARGTQDLGDDSMGCEPYTSGQNRNERFFNFLHWWRPSCPAPHVTTADGGHCDTVDYVDVGHDAGSMFASPAGQARLFQDNFYGDGARAYDFAYPRMLPGDDPFPDPAQANTTIPGPSTGPYAGNMTYAGCWVSASSTDAMRYLQYDDTNNTIALCSQTCAALGYSVAGLMMSTRCYCDGSVSSTAILALDTACTDPCPGNALEICGASARLSVYASGTLALRHPPSHPPTVGEYSYAACYSEATSGRALAGSQYSDPANMTLESCAHFCAGSPYFGTEYASQCYCGSYLRNGSSVLASANCTMACTGNGTELCGGSSSLSVYELTSLNGTVVAGPGTSSLCPAADGNTVPDAGGQPYTVHCASDCSGSSYSSSTATESYLECMSACDADSECQAFTYVGGTNGDGGGTCWLKSSYGASIAQASNYISAARIAPNSSSIHASTTRSTIRASTSTTSSASSSSTGLSCPAANQTLYTALTGATFLIECGVDHAGGDLRSTTVVPNDLVACITACANTTGCVDVSLLGAGCYLKSSVGATSLNSEVLGAKLAGDTTAAG